MKLMATNACFDVARTRLVGPVSLQVQAGQLLAIVGPNGAGKSTLLRMLAGDLRPTEGEVRLDGTDVSNLSVRDLARRRAVLGQHHSEEIAFTVTQVVQMGRYSYRSDPSVSPSDNEAAVATAIHRLDLDALAQRAVAGLSGGELQRTALARALAQQAPLLLLDEPTTALDIGHQQLVAGVLRSLAGDGCAVVAVLHDLNLAGGADDVLLLDRGSVAAHGSPSTVLTSERLTSVYDYPIEVVDHPLRSGALIIPRPAE